MSIRERTHQSAVASGEKGEEGALLAAAQRHGHAGTMNLKRAEQAKLERGERRSFAGPCCPRLATRSGFLGRPRSPLSGF